MKHASAAHAAMVTAALKSTLKQARADEACSHELGHQQKKHRNDDDERAQKARSPAGKTRREEAGQGGCAARRQPRRHDELQQQATRTQADGKREAVMAPGENRPGHGEKKRRRYRIGGDRQAAEQRREVLAGRIPAPSATAAAAAMPSAQ